MLQEVEAEAAERASFPAAACTGQEHMCSKEDAPLRLSQAGEVVQMEGAKRASKLEEEKQAAAARRAELEKEAELQAVLRKSMEVRLNTILGIILMYCVLSDP